jgi:hypothetical protein
MDKFEYIIFRYDPQAHVLKTSSGDIRFENMYQTFTDLGQEGWELVTAVPLVEPGVGKALFSNAVTAAFTNSVHYTFKRRKP